MGAKRGKAPGLAELKTEIGLLRDQYVGLPDDDLFVLWFVFAFVSGARDEAADSLTGASNEKGIDAVHLDHDARLVTLVQGKYRRALMKATEKRPDVIAFAALGQQLVGDESDFATLKANLEGGALEKVKKARRAIRERGYRLNLHYATLGKCSDAITEDARRMVRSVDIPSEHPPRLTVLDGTQVLAVLADYLDGVAPPVPSIELRVDNAQEKVDERTGVSSWIFSANGFQMGQLVEQYGVKLFARNIRGDLGGATAVNKEIRQTLRDDPASFWYLNNGITIVCDEAMLESTRGRLRLHLTNPQIINGQQTTYALADEPNGAARADVSVRVIRISERGASDDFAAYDAMVGRIVEATNSQNKIKAADLRSNDRVQVGIERDLHQLGYHYQRKRASATMVAAAARRHEWRVRKEDLAKAVAACENSAAGRRGTDVLFEEPRYRRTFGYRTDHMLCRWWLWKLVEVRARGHSDLQRAKWVTLRFLWDDLAPAIRKRPSRFIGFCERSHSYGTGASLDSAIGHAFKGTLAYYRQERGKGADRVELSTFFKRQDLDPSFDRFWRSRKNPHRNRYEKAAKRFAEDLAT
ncbi:MAG TPA: AIPR family protein [Solirubrobacterales bacterium]